MARAFRLSVLDVSDLSDGGSGQQPFNLSDDLRYFGLIGQGNHKKLVTLVKTDNSVCKQPDAVQEGITS